jgi:hypothetical protein
VIVTLTVRPRSIPTRRVLFIASILVMARLHGASLAASDESGGEPKASLLGRWTQNETGPLLTTRKVFTFEADRQYDFVLTARSPGSVSEHVLGRETGRYEMDAGRIVLFPATGYRRAYRFVVERDPVLGQPSLVLIDGDGTRSRYHR